MIRLSYALFLFIAFSPLVFGQPGTITGTVVDTSGASIANAQVKLSTSRETQSAAGGEFSLTNVEPGPFSLAISAKNFTPKTISGELKPGESLSLPPVTLAVATLNTEVNVPSDPSAIAEAQIKQEETQRFFGLVPNYFVSYLPDAAPLNTRQKFELTWRTFLDPSAFVITGIDAAVQQAQNTNKGFGQGAQGYAKRYGASYANFGTSLVLASVVFPTVFKQDPRYFYQGTGSSSSRAWHAISWAVLCRGDNKKVQFCYSSLLATAAAGYLTNYYYPKKDRDSNAVIAQGIGIGIGGNALGNLFQEFVARKITRRKP